MPDLTGQILDDKYRIDRSLGEGGMGAVYLATHVGTERPVALKVITARYMKNEEFVERFRREARAAGRLIHPNVVNVTDFGFARVDSHRVAYLVMEYLDGCSLADILAEEARLPLAWVVDIVEQVCSAIDEAHRQGILHRDLKPDNIWLEPNRRGGYTAKVLDFGLAKLAEPAAPADKTDPSRPATAQPLTSSLPRVGSEAAMQIQSGSDAPAEDATRIMPNAEATVAVPRKTQVEDREAGESDATRIMPNAEATAANPRKTQVEERKAGNANEATGEDATLLVEARGTAGVGGRKTASGDGLTQVGSVLGTPLYMSPEQCLGHALDLRSDIYSLGVIAYQMLSGDTPFTGDVHAVMRGHIELPPPPIRTRNADVPKKVAQLIMSALSKNAADRPPTAEAFASALRANAEGAGPLLRRAFALYSEHFPTFLKVSFLMSIPLIVVGILQFVTAVLGVLKKAPDLLLTIAVVVLALLAVGFSFIASGVTIGVTVRLVTQFLLAPLRPIKLRPAFDAIKRRIKPFALTTLLVAVVIIIGWILCLIPGVIFQIKYSLYGPVVIMEGLGGRAAMRRSRDLVKRAVRTVTMVVIVQLLLTIGLQSFINVSFAIIAQLLVARPNVPIWLTNLSKIIQAAPGNLIAPWLNVLTTPLIAIFTAMLYMKTRLAGGESLHEVLEEIDEQEVPTTRWQQRMRQRLILTPASGETRSRPSSSGAD
ncbi:MAG TPA: protein kinase [Blastocatellia bacterium]|nr:protein kinase [Blastocatellia bacterium]